MSLRATLDEVFAYPTRVCFVYLQLHGVQRRAAPLPPDQKIHALASVEGTGQFMWIDLLQSCPSNRRMPWVVSTSAASADRAKPRSRRQLDSKGILPPPLDPPFGADQHADATGFFSISLVAATRAESTAPCSISLGRGMESPVAGIAQTASGSSLGSNCLIPVHGNAHPKAVGFRRVAYRELKRTRKP